MPIVAAIVGLSAGVLTVNQTFFSPTSNVNLAQEFICKKCLYVTFFNLYSQYIQ